MTRKPRAEFEITAKDRASAVLKQVDGRLQAVSRTALGGTRALGGLAGAAGLGSFVVMADNFNRLKNSIKFLTRETGNFDAVLKGLTETAIDTGGELESSLDTFRALDRVRTEIGLTDETILQLNDNLQKLGAIGGTSSEAFSNGIRQLNQSFAGGIVRAEEFNSLLENTPEIAARIAKGFGVTQGQLRLMVNAGKVFSNDVARVLLEQTDEIQSDFEAIPNNLDRAFGSLKTAIGLAFAELDSKVGLTENLANLVQNIADTASAVGTGNAAENVVTLRVALDDANASLEALEGKTGGGQSNPARRIGPIRSEAAKLEVQLISALQRLADLNGAPIKAALQSTVSELEKVRDRIEEINEEGLANRTVTASLKALGVRAEELELQLERLLALEKDVRAVPRAAPSINPTVSVTGEKELAAERKKQEAIFNLRQEFRGIQTAAEAAQREALFEHELAQLAGFENTKAQLEFEREEQRFRAKLEGNELRFEEEMAQALGFNDRRHQIQVEQEEQLQIALIQARTKGNKLAERAQIALLKFDKANAVGKTKILLGEAKALTSGLASLNQALFGDNKKAAIANAIVSTAAGAASALDDVPYPANIIAVANVLAAGAAQIASIKSTSFGGGGGLSSAGGGGGSAGGFATAEPLIRDIPVVSAEERSGSIITLRIEVDDPLMETIFQQARIMTDEGDEAFISVNSRQAQDLDSRGL